MAGTRIQKPLRIVRADPTTDVKPAGVGAQRIKGGLVISLAQHDYVSTEKRVLPVEVCIPSGGVRADKILMWTFAVIPQCGSYDLLYPAIMNVNARAEPGHEPT